MAAIALRNIAACQVNLNRFEEALCTYQDSRDYCEAHGLTRLVGEVDYNIAYLHYLKGEYTQAIQLYQVTRQFCDQEGDEYHRALCDLDQAELCIELNLVEEGTITFTDGTRRVRKVRDAIRNRQVTYHPVDSI